MAPENSVSGSDEATTPENASLRPCERPDTSPADLTPESRPETPQDSEAISQTTSIQNPREVDGVVDGAMLSELQKSLHKISNGVDELAATAQDLFGLADSSDNSDSDDYQNDGDDVPVFSWAKLKSNAKRRRQRRLRAESPTASSLANGAKDNSESDEEDSKKRLEIIPDIRECNFEQFQSVPAVDGHKLYCVDVLIAGDSLDKDIEDFKETVAKMKIGTRGPLKPGHIRDPTEDSRFEDNGKKWIRRIRINSRVVLRILRHFRPVSRSRGRLSCLFLRPFQLLVSSHEEMKEQLAKMIAKSCGGSNDMANSTGSDLNTTRNGDHKTAFLDLGDEKNAIDELKCFVEFMETRIMPDSRRYRDFSSPLPKTIRYEDLWYLFKPGDLVYITRDATGRERYRSSPFSQCFLRIIHTHMTSTSPAEPLGFKRDPLRRWSFLGHYIDHDGKSYSPAQYLIPHISPFRGEKKVTELLAYPVSYIEDEQLLAQAISDGANYVSLIQRRYGFYSGWTQTINPSGVPIMTDSPEDRLSSPEHIESDILVDFQETFNALPDWRPSYYLMVAEDEGLGDDTSLSVASDMPVIQRDDEGRTSYLYVEDVLRTDTTELTEARRFMNDDPLGQFRRNTRTAPTGKFLALLPRRFFAYAVLQRRFVPLDPRFIRASDLDANDKAFGKLEINREYKRLIQALVKSHFEKVETEKRTNVEIQTQDLIRGKGKGVVILLHGVPGVGKTATAEAVALKWKKPLFPITCGDLGYTAEALEKSLSEIFRLAHHWGCILLLDEADVFITQRERHDLKRNALVSAFLRVLEYYNGIMFLTTNRAGVLDEAVKSRVHLNLHYDHLTEDQTVAIFKQHIQRLRDIERQRNPDENEQIKVIHKEIIQFARDHFNQRGNSHGLGNSVGRWNGRQIRNAFLIASSLAHYDSEEEGDEEDMDDLAEPGRKKQKQLGRSQFELVARTTLMYDQYRQSVHSGKSDDHVAFEREEREKPSLPRSPTPERMKKASMGFN